MYFSLWKKRSTDTIGYAYPPIPFQLPSVKQYLEASNPREKECFTAVQMIRKYLTQGNIQRAGGRKKSNYIFDSIHEDNVQVPATHHL